MTGETQQQTRNTTPEEDIRELYSRTAKLNDAISALLSPAWGSEAGIIPTDHPLYVGEEPLATQEEQGTPVDWPAIVRQRERELKKVGEARHQAEELLRVAHETSNRSEAERAHAVQRAEQLATTLDEVLRHFVHKGHPGEPCLQTGWISTRTVQRWRAVLHPPEPAPPAHDGGPSVAEAAADDKRWPLQKAGE